MAKRVPFTTTLKKEILTDFKIKCNDDGEKLNVVLELLMKAYMSEKVKIKKEIILK